MVNLDVIIPTYGRPELINLTLKSILNLAPLPNSVIVINQTPNIKNADYDIINQYKKIGLDLIWINSENPSLCGARNDGLRASKSEILLFLDDDVIFPANLVGAHYNAYKDGAVSAVGGQVYHRKCNFDIDRISLETPEFGTLAAHHSSTKVWGGPLFGGHFSIRRAIAFAVGGWDESFIGSANWEEGDLINRLMNSGLVFVWDPCIWLIHLRAPTGGCRIPGNNLFPEWTKTTNFFLYKYRYPRDKSWSEVLFSAMKAGPLRKEIIQRPWRWPSAWTNFFIGWFKGCKMARKPILPIQKCHNKLLSNK